MPLNPLAAELKQLNDRVYALERSGVYPPAVADASWNVVGDAGKPAFQNSWVNYPTGGWPTAAYRIDSEGWVIMRGLLTGGLNNTTAFTLPVGYRPAFTQMIRSNAADGAGYVAITSDGRVTPFGSSLTHFSLGQISFPTWNTDKLVLQRTSLPPYISDTQLRLTRMAIRRSGMVEMLGLTGPLVIDTVTTSGAVPAAIVTLASKTELNGIGPDYGDIYGVHGIAPNIARIDLADNKLKAVTTLATWGILGGIRWPLPSIEAEYTNLTLTGSWVNFGWGGAHYWGPARYYKDSNGYVHLRGLVSGGATATSLVGTLPAGFRPGGRTMFSTISNGVHAGCDVDSNGQITPRNYVVGSYLSLAGISFLAEN